MLMKFNKLIIITHAINCVWILRLLQIGMEGENARRNYWEDSIFVIFLLTSCCIQIYRWIKISKDQINLEPESSIFLKIQLQKIADEMFGRTPYLLRISPSGYLLDELALNYVENNMGKIIRARITLQRMLFDIKNFTVVNLMISIVSGLYIYFGNLPSYAEYLSHIPIFSVIILCMAGGLFINSAALLMFWVFLFFNRRA